MRQDVKNRKIEQVLTHTKHSKRYLPTRIRDNQDLIGFMWP